MVTPSMTIIPRDLEALLKEHDVGPASYDDERVAALVLDYCGIEFEGDGAPDGGPTQYDEDCGNIARLCARLADTVQRMRQQMDTATTAPSVTLKAAVAEPYVCSECDEQACICWAYDQDRAAPDDVDPGERVQEASAIQAHRRRALAKVAAARALHMAVTL